MLFIAEMRKGFYFSRQRPWDEWETGTEAKRRGEVVCSFARTTRSLPLNECGMCKRIAFTMVIIIIAFVLPLLSQASLVLNCFASSMARLTGEETVQVRTRKDERRESMNRSQ
jgi:hypothetical protein